MAYHQACNLGELRLKASEARIVDRKNRSTPGRLAWEWGTPEYLSQINLAYPPRTSIFIATYTPKYPQQAARVCQVRTNVITREDAERAFLSAVHNPNVRRDLNPARANTPFEIDRPKEGYKKRLMFIEPDWVVLETALYKEAH